MAFKDLLDFSGKNVVITGGLGQIGYEVSRAFAEYNAHVIIVDIDEAKFQVLVSRGDLSQDRHSFVNVDIGNPERMHDVIARLVAQYQTVDVWVNLAYPRTPDWGNTIENVTAESWDQNIKMHLGGYFWSSKWILEQMKKQGQGCLINFGSTYGVVGPNFDVYEGTEMTMPVAYAAIKGAIGNLTRYFSTYYGKNGIRVNTICPGGVFNNQPPQFVERYNTLTPLGRMAKAAELAIPTVFLASDAASYITGHTLMVDGGWTAW